MWWAGFPIVPGLWAHHAGIKVLSYPLVNLDLDVAAHASTEDQSSHCIQRAQMSLKVRWRCGVMILESTQS